jgi:uncharacterized membrane protein
MIATTTPHRLSEYLRHGDDAELRRRRGVVALSLAACASMGLIALYQTGLIGHLPNPPVPMLDSDKVDASDEAYSKVSTPDSLLGLTSYAVTAVLAAAGGRDRARRRPWLSLALAGKVLVDSLFSVRLLWVQPVKYKAWCFWCLIAAAATFGSIALIVPEARAAIRQLVHRD